MKRFAQLLIALLCLSLPAQGTPSNFIFKHFYDPSHPLTNIINIDIDRNGMVWVSSGIYGLFRFDGYTYNTIGELSGIDSLTLLKGDIHIDARNRLWILHAGKIRRYDCDQNHMIATPFDTLAIGAMRGEGDTVLLTVADNLYRYSDDTLRLLTPHCGRVIGASAARYFTLNGRQIHSIDPRTGAQTSCDSPIPTGIIHHIQQTSTGEWLIGTYRQGLLLYNPATGALRTLVPNDIIRDIEPDGSQFWIASESGLYLYDASDRTLRHIQKDWSRSYSLSDNAVYSVKTSPEGGLWVGTYFRGLSYLPRHALDYEYLNPSQMNQTHRGNVVRTMAADGSGVLWIGTEDGGLNRYDPHSDRMTNYALGNADHPLSGTNVHGVHYYDGHIWAGTFKEGIDVIDPASGRIVRHYDTSTGNGLIDNFVLDFLTAPDGTLYVGTSLGVQQYHPATDRFSTLLSGIGVIALELDAMGQLWIGTSPGLYRSTPDKSRFREITLSANPQSRNVNFVTADHRQHIWVGTENGLYEFTPANETPQYHQLSENSLERDVKSIVEDRFGHLWLSTSGGIIRFDPQSRTQTLFPMSSEPCGSRFNYNSVYRDTLTDAILFGSLNGMIRFTPRENYSDRTAPKPVISSFAYNDPTHYTTLHRNFTDTTLDRSLPYDRNFLRIGLFTPGIFSSDKVFYAYRLEGYTKEWVKTDRDIIELQNLDPGHYRLEVCTVDPDGNYSRAISHVTFTIAPPLWLTTIAKILYLLIGLGLVLAVIRFIRNRERQKRERFEQKLKVRQEQELYEAKIDFFTTIAHEIRTPLTLIKAPLDEIAEHPTADRIDRNLPIVMRHTQWLTNLCTQLLDFQSVEKGAYRLNPSVTDLRRLTSEIVDDFAPSFHAKGITPDEELGGEQPIMAVIDTDIFHKVVGNLLQNALKYSRHTVQIRLTRAPQQLRLSILNDGHLIRPSEERSIFTLFTRLEKSQIGSGIGLPFARELVRIHGWELELLFDTPGLNHFQLTIPLQVPADEPTPATASPADPHQAEPSTTGRSTVLVVEDNDELRQYIASLLDEHYRILTAPNSEQALASLDSQEVDLVLSDVMMPGMDGIELCKRIKSNDATCHLPVILLTADVSIATKLSALEYGADDYIEKPFSGKYLIARLANILATRRRLYEEFARKPLTISGCLGNRNRAEREFTERLQELIDHHIDNTELDVDFVASHLGMSRATLYRKARAYMEMSIADFITLCRLKRAAQLLTDSRHTVAEVAYMVGFSSPSYFTTRFTKQFGQTPSEFVNSLKNKV